MPILFALTPILSLEPEKMGFKKEGLKENSLIVDGKYVDVKDGNKYLHS